MPEVILLKRHTANVPLGFKIQGGQDFSIPLSLLEVTPNSLADQVGLRPGDAILKIGNMDTTWMEHNRAKQEILNAGNEFWLTIERNAVNTNKPQFTPLSALKPKVPQNMPQYSQPSIVKTSLAIDKGHPIAIGSSHNRAPMPFNTGVGSTITYQAQKPTNWTPGDYTRLNDPAYNGQPMNNSYNSPQEQQYASPQQQYNPVQQYSQPQQQYSPAPQIQNNQYNSPIGLYSKANLMKEIRTQTKVNTSHNQTPDFQQKVSQSQYTMQPQNSMPIQNSMPTQNSMPQQIYQNPINYEVSRAQPLRSSAQPRGGSLSMRMLDRDLKQSEGTDQQCTSVFDLKRGNPTGATVPRGFKSVMAPVELPPDQRHAPMRKEYQVNHVKQNWVEPKML